MPGGMTLGFAMHLVGDFVYIFSAVEKNVVQISVL